MVLKIRHEKARSQTLAPEMGGHPRRACQAAGDLPGHDKPVGDRVKGYPVSPSLSVGGVRKQNEDRR